jgi:hypothetical protein
MLFQVSFQDHLNNEMIVCIEEDQTHFHIMDAMEIAKFLRKENKKPLITNVDTGTSYTHLEVIK